MKLKINQEYFKLVPRPSPEEYEALKESIKTEGQEIPIIINGADEILDGYSRNQICIELGIEPKFVQKTFANKLLEKKFVIEVNLKRRHLNDFQRVEMGQALLAIEKELAKEREKMSKGQGIKVEPIDATLKGKATEKVAQRVGVSEKTFERATKIIEQAPERTKEQLRKGELSISGVHDNIILTENLTKDKQKEIEPHLYDIKTEMRKENLSQEEKKKVVENISAQEQRGKIEDIDIERAVKTVKVESLTKNKSPEVQKKAKELVEQKIESGERFQTFDIVREAEEDAKVQSLIPTSTPEQIKQMFASADPNVVAQNISKNTQRMTRKDLIQLIESMIVKNSLKCPKCGERKIKWKCGHDFE